MSDFTDVIQVDVDVDINLYPSPVLECNSWNSEFICRSVTILFVYYQQGTKGETDPKKLDKWFHNDFEAGQKDEYRVKTKDIGEPLLVTLKQDGSGLYSDWFVDRVTIKVKGDDAIYDFPCNRWVQSEIIIFEGTGNVVNIFKDHFETFISF